ncbi:MAG TPA: hypothetical protein VFB15_11735 [Candidatus Binataceae bacterium]|nr:hypothetical protein [Candidatus Binataceae bacterium]
MRDYIAAHLQKFDGASYFALDLALGFLLLDNGGVVIAAGDHARRWACEVTDFIHELVSYGSVTVSYDLVTVLTG